ncbi:hypothetical protein SHY50_10255, partial [Streptococcus suis]|nr:hypothetical protein [Streptococcus suis]
WERFTLNLQPGGAYTIGSMQFPNVFLRMDGSAVKRPIGSGSGIVNCQYTARTWEQFTLNQQAGGTYTIGSVQFPNVFLRMDGSGVT